MIFPRKAISNKHAGHMLYYLAGGFIYLLFFIPKLGEKIPNLTNIFPMG